MLALIYIGSALEVSHDRLASRGAPATDPPHT